MTKQRKRIEYLLGPLGAVATAVFFVALLFGPMFAADKANDRISERLDVLVTKQGVNPVELSSIVGHPVDRVCIHFGYGYSIVRDLAETYGVTVDVPDYTETPERSYGVFVIGPDRATYGALRWDIFDSPAGPDCHAGGRLAIQFDTIDPLSGGRLVDLDAPDLQPTAYEWRQVSAGP